MCDRPSHVFTAILWGHQATRKVLLRGSLSGCQGRGTAAKTQTSATGDVLQFQKQYTACVMIYSKTLWSQQCDICICMFIIGEQQNDQLSTKAATSVHQKIEWKCTPEGSGLAPKNNFCLSFGETFTAQYSGWRVPRVALVVKNMPANAGDEGLIPGSGRSPGEGDRQPAPVFLPGESHGQRSLVGSSPWDHRVRHY